MCTNIFKNINAVGEDGGTRHVPLSQLSNLQTKSVVLKIFKEYQNPLALHTWIMCSNILPNINTVALQMKEKIAEQDTTSLRWCVFR